MGADGVVLVDRDGRAVWWNAAVGALNEESREGHARLLDVVVTAAAAGADLVTAQLPTERGLLARELTLADIGGGIRVASFPIDEPSGTGVDEHTRRLEAMLEHTDDLITLISADGTIRSSNRAAGRLTGLSGGGVNGRNATEFVHPEDVDEATSTLAHVLATPGATSKTSARVRFADGEYHEVDASVTNLLEDPSVASLVVSMHDVTDRRLAEQQVARSEAMLRSLVENLTDVIVVLDDRFEVTWATPGIEAIIDAPAATNMGMSAFNDVHPDDLERVTGTLARMAAAPLGEQARIELRLEARPGTGKWRWIEATVVNRLEDPHVAGLVCTLRDVTESKVAAAELQGAFDRLRELDHMKDQFLASVSHEMRTPLAVIIGFADLLGRGDAVDAPTRAEAIGRIRASAAEMRSMVENLLDFSALEAGKLKLALVPVRVGRVVDAVMTATHAILDEHPVSIDVPAELRVVGDAEALERALRNLVANAARYSDSGDPISITARPIDGDEVVIEVADQGIGIAEEQQPLVFERLYRGPGAAFLARGTGVGLNLVKRYVELMGGTVTVRSEVGVGSTFAIRLPAAA